MQATDFDYERQRIRAMESLFRAFDDLCEGTVMVDREARVVWINERYAARFGIADAKSAIGKEVEEIIPTSLMREVVRTGRPLLLDILEVNGQSFVVTRIPIKDDDGEIIGAIGFVLYDKLQPLQPLYARLHRLQHQLAQTQQHLAAERRAKYTFSNYIGNSTAAARVKQQARRAAQLDATVLLLGETGTGKELLAHAIHAASPRAGKPFVGFNVAAIPESLLEAECFGAMPGAYTGADRKARVGKFELADRGTLFLDEIGDMPLAVQAKLLRVLQENEVEPLGGNKVVKIDVRVIAATSRDLKAEVAAGRFRPDLFYRLNVLTIRLPALRERTEDFGPLCDHILEQIAARTRLALRELEPGALALLKRCPWPGNLRELRNVLEQASMLADGLHLGEADIRGIVTPTEPATDLSAAAAPVEHPGTHAEAMAAFERDLIAQALRRNGGRVAETATQLGLGRATLYKKMATLNIPSRSRDVSVAKGAASRPPLA